MKKIKTSPLLPQEFVVESSDLVYTYLCPYGMQVIEKSWGKSFAPKYLVSHTFALRNAQPVDEKDLKGMFPVKLYLYKTT